MTRDPIHGLTAADASARLTAEGPNELPQDAQRSLLKIASQAVREPMLQLLLAAGLIYLVLGSTVEALVLLGFSFINLILVIVQERRTENALHALRDLTSPRARVLRDGVAGLIPARELVRGDVLLLAEGDRVPGDAELIEAQHLMADESLLTGESVPVRKIAGNPTAPQPDGTRPGGEDTPLVWSGTLIIAGTAEALVRATGPRSEIGRIGADIRRVSIPTSPLQLQTRRLVRYFAAAGISASILLAVALGITTGNWLDGILAGITLAMATLPEEFPLVLTLYLVLGARRLSRRFVLARNPSSVEALGAATLLCTDKTGTLTQNRMEVARLVTAGGTLDLTAPDTRLPENFHELLEYALLASRPDPFDPMEQAFQRLGESELARTEHLHADWALQQSFPLEPGLMAMSMLWRQPDGTLIAAAKGAPEAIADLCHLPPDQLVTIRAQVATLAEQGLRVLGVAGSRWTGAAAPAGQHDITYGFIGLVGIADPLRPDAARAVASCRAAGIRVAMITGDHPATACAIARQAGIPADQVLTGSEIAALDDAALDARLATTNVFARVLPEQKLRLVHAFEARGEIVAMTGDGVNDAPSLKAANIGVAMGGRGTEVAREAASLVLLRDDFASLVAAVRLGRSIDDNLRKAFAYILAVHVPIAGAALLPVLFGWPLLIGPIAVVFLEMVTDPIASLLFESEPAEHDIMSRPPRDPKHALFDRALVLRGLSQGVVALCVLMGLTWYARSIAGEAQEALRILAFLSLVLGNLALVFANRSLRGGFLRGVTRPNPAIGWVCSAIIGTLALVLVLPPLRTLFGFGADPRWDLALLATGGAVVILLANEAMRLALRARG